MKVSIFSDSNTLDTVVEFNKVVEAIKLGNNLKMQFSPSGVIHVSGNKKNILIYTGLVLLTFDVGSDEELESIFRRASEISNTNCCFRNYDERTLYVLVKTDCIIGHHKTGYEQVVKAYENYLNLKISANNPDIFILCSITHDPNIYYNFSSNVFQVDFRTTKTIITEHDLKELYKVAFDSQVEYTNKYIELSSKNWNDYYAVLASNSFNAGIPMYMSLEFLLLQNQLTPDVKGIFERVYRTLTTKKRVNDKELVYSVYFKNFFKYKPGVEIDVRIFFELLIFKSIAHGIPFYYTAKMILQETGIKRTRRETIENDFIDRGLIYVYTKKENEEDKWPKTYYHLRLENLKRVAQELMVDANEFIDSVMPLLLAKNNASGSIKYGNV